MTIDRERHYAPATLLAQAGMPEPDASGAIAPGAQFSTTFLREPDNTYRSGRSYARSDNPTFNPVEELLAKLEEGFDSLLFASGMAAATSLFLSLEPGAHVVAPKVMYWALRAWLKTHAAAWGLAVDFVDMTSPKELEACVRPGSTRLIWVETPANPTWAITDVAHAADVAHGQGAILAVDNTASTPLITQPLVLGADLVMHSCTKYLNGHDNALCGALVASEPSALWDKIRSTRRSLGCLPGTMDAWLLLNGMRTLGVRLERACESAMLIAEAMVKHPQVEQVLYPGLPGHPGHAVARRQMRSFGGLFSLIVRGGEQAAIEAAAKMRLWRRATSFGGPESLVEHRRSVEGEDSPAVPGLLRFSTGLEDPLDLVGDLTAALNR
jgi:cystathionine gamma-synthase